MAKSANSCRELFASIEDLGREGHPQVNVVNTKKKAATWSQSANHGISGNSALTNTKGKHKSMLAQSYSRNESMAENPSGGTNNSQTGPSWSQIETSGRYNTQTTNKIGDRVGTGNTDAEESIAGVTALLADLPVYSDYLQDSWPEFITKFEIICHMYGVKGNCMTALLLRAER